MSSCLATWHADKGSLERFSRKGNGIFIPISPALAPGFHSTVSHQPVKSAAFGPWHALIRKYHSKSRSRERVWRRLPVPVIAWLCASLMRVKVLYMPGQTFCAVRCTERTIFPRCRETPFWHCCSTEAVWWSGPARFLLSPGTGSTLPLSRTNTSQLNAL